MSDISGAMTFVSLLDKCNRIEIPKIQRDFAQGRESESEVRLGFLNALYNALSADVEKQKKPMSLDFIYGSMEQDADGIYFLPLDGQQRLTTLFILHWYLAWKDDQLLDFQRRLWNGRHSRFSYRVRPSSTEFFDELVLFIPKVRPDETSSIKQLLIDQSWFFLRWSLDPTIQSALTMLDSIHERFQTSSGLYARLLNESHPAITFQLLQLENFGLSDDLYIKMNARGKPLTPFETFKAQFEEDIKNLFPTEHRKIDDEIWSICDFFAIRMDTQWVDFFWQYRSGTNNSIDVEVMNLLWTLALLSLDPERPDFLKATTLLQNKKALVSYSVLRDGGMLTHDFTNMWIALLEAWSAGGGRMARQVASVSYFDEEAIFRKAIKSQAALNYAELLQFGAFILYINHWQSEVDTEALQQWMRIVSNLASNTGYDHLDVFQRCMASLRKLLPESRQILSYFAEMDAARLGGFSPQQVQEEVLKAKLILADSDWRELIEKAETHAYFNGQIEFLLEFSGLRQLRVDGLSTIDHKEKQKLFEEYFAKASITFNKDGLVDPVGSVPCSYLWQRALLSVGDYLLPIGSNQSFGTNIADNADSWKRFLRGGRPDAVARRANLKYLWDRLNGVEDLGKQLELIIESAKDLDPWREKIVAHPQVIDFCLEKEVRKVGSNKVYLLKRRQMNGAHAELFSYVLYLNRQDISLEEGLEVFGSYNYKFVSESSLEPKFQLSFIGMQHPIIFSIESRHDGLTVCFSKTDVFENSDIENELIHEMGFLKETGGIFLSIKGDSVTEVLQQLASVLSRIGS